MPACAIDSTQMTIVSRIHNAVNRPIGNNNYTNIFV